jgi:hypothetical protein
MIGLSIANQSSTLHMLRLGSGVITFDNDLSNGGFVAHRNHPGVEMRQKSGQLDSQSERLVKNIRPATCKQNSNCSPGY